MITRPRSLRPLVLVTLANYVSLVPYYIHNDASADHPLPALRAVVLVAATLAWFLVGVRGFIHQRRWGRPILLTFLAAEAALYAKTFVTGAVIHQMQNPSTLVRAVFVVGYVSGLVAVIYLALLARSNGPTRPAEGRGPSRDNDTTTKGGTGGGRLWAVLGSNQ